jgi:hypothetical protein
LLLLLAYSYASLELRLARGWRLVERCEPASARPLRVEAGGVHREAGLYVSEEGSVPPLARTGAYVCV